MEQYREMISQILEVTPIREDEIFDYKHSPYKNEFNDLFKFYNEAISRHKHFGVDPHLLFYHDDYTPNAAATKKNGHFIMYINAGTIVYLIQKYKSVKIPLPAKFEAFEKHLDTSITDLMYDVALHYTFYHELGHLIQQSDLLESTLHERPKNDEGFSIYRHVLELDADTFSSLCLGTLLHQYAKQLFGSKMTSTQVSKLIVIACCSAFMYLLTFQSNLLPIYYEEYTHPHPVIRISCIVFHIVDYCSQTLGNYHLKLDKQKIIKEAMSLAHSITADVNERSIITQYQTIIRLEAKNIEEYVRKIRAIEKGDTSLSAYKWNQEVLKSNL